MARGRKVANLLGLAVLAYLSQRPMHPYELSKTLREHGDDRSIKFNHGSLYMVIRQLAKAGFVAEHETEREGQRPERTVYAITESGRQELTDWLRELVREPTHEYPRFVAALSLISALPPSQVVPLLRTRLAGLDAQRTETRALIDGAEEHGLHPLFLVEEDYRLTMLDAEYGFVEQFLARITDADSGWGRLWGEYHGEESPFIEGRQP